MGDPDQNIYSWRGSETSIIIHFEDYFSPLNTIILNQNYRSTKNIIEHSNSLIAYNKES